MCTDCRFLNLLRTGCFVNVFCAQTFQILQAQFVCIATPPRSCVNIRLQRHPSQHVLHQDCLYKDTTSMSRDDLELAYIKRRLSACLYQKTTFSSPISKDDLQLAYIKRRPLARLYQKTTFSLSMSRDDLQFVCVETQPSARMNREKTCLNRSRFIYTSIFRCSIFYVFASLVFGSYQFDFLPPKYRTIQDQQLIYTLYNLPSDFRYF